MNIKTCAVVACLAAAGFIGAGQSTPPGGPTGLHGPYLGQTPPGKEPVVFAPGIVSLEGSKESACSLSPDGRELYFTRSGNRIMFSRLTDQGWTSPAPLLFAEGAAAMAPHVTLDNKRLYWNWAKPFPSIYMAERTSGGWSEPRLAGEGMFVSSDREGRMYVTHMGTKSDFISQAILKEGRIAGYQDLKGGIEAIRGRSDSVAHPGVAPDGGYVVFDIEAGRHLFVSFRQPDGSWGEAVDLTPYGLDPKAGQATVSPDGKYLFFHLNNDIYWVSTQLIKDLKGA